MLNIGNIARYIYIYNKVFSTTSTVLLFLHSSTQTPYPGTIILVALKEEKNSNYKDINKHKTHIQQYIENDIYTLKIHFHS